MGLVTTILDAIFRQIKSFTGPTMPIDSIASTSASLRPAGLGQQDFIRILLTQLSYQDPMKPMDNQQFMAQMAQFTNLEQSQQINDKIATLVSQQAALQSVGLVGRTVDIKTEGGMVTGSVTALSLATDSPTLTLQLSTGGVLSDIALSQIVNVR